MTQVQVYLSFNGHCTFVSSKIAEQSDVQKTHNFYSQTIQWIEKKIEKAFKLSVQYCYSLKVENIIEFKFEKITESFKNKNK